MARKKDSLLGPVLGLAFLLIWFFPKYAISLIIFIVIFVGFAVFLGVKIKKSDKYQNLFENQHNNRHSNMAHSNINNSFRSTRTNSYATDPHEKWAFGVTSANSHLQEPYKKWTLELLRIIEWKRFEEICADYFEEIGFTAKTQKSGADGGIDIHLFWRDSPKHVAIAQCKAWAASNVGVAQVRELYGVMMSEGVREAFFLATGDFTDDAKKFAQDKNLTLVTGDELVKRINELPDERKGKLLIKATWGDYATPTCASCGIKMVRRKGKFEFWGCANFPRCRTTMKIKKNV